MSTEPTTDGARTSRIARGRAGRWDLLRAGVGIAISVLAVALVVAQVDLPSVGRVLGAADPWFVAALIGTTCLDLTFRTLRWRGLLAPIRRVAFLATLRYVLIGYLANNLLPARLGELVRSHYVGSREGLSRATALGTVVVERVVDTTVLVALASAALLLLHIGGVLGNAVLLGLGLTGLLIVVLIVGLAAHRLPFAGAVAGAINRWPALLGLAGRLRDGLAVAGRPRTIGPAIGWSALAWTATIVGFAAAGRSVGVELSWTETVLLASGVALSLAIPAGPGNVGTFELVGVQIGAVLGVPPASALALTLLAHAASIVVTSVGGGIALLQLGWAGDPRADPAPSDPNNWGNSGGGA